MSGSQTPQEELTLGAVGLRVGNGIWANSESAAPSFAPFKVVSGSHRRGRSPAHALKGPRKAIGPGSQRSVPWGWTLSDHTAVKQSAARARELALHL